jgi:hypothetical protein
MAIRLTRRSIPLIALGAWLAACGAGTKPAAAAACDRVAAPNGSDRADGTYGDPFRSAQRLADSLRPGETGCLRAGTYSTGRGFVLRFNRGGRPGAPVVVRSYPGERATLAGPVYVPQGSDNVTIADLDVSDTTSYGREHNLTMHLMASGIRLQGTRITNGGRKTCVLLGHRDYGRAVRTVITGNRFEHCGSTAHGMLDHAVYVSRSVGVQIVDNTFTDTAGYAVHLYPDAQRTLVRGNLMDRNGGGVIFAGEGGKASSDNLVEGNVITGNRREPAIRSYWGGRVGTGNVARDNCVDDAVRVTRGFAARGNIVAEITHAARASRASVVRNCVRAASVSRRG